ncbi:MAG: hypothetical protein ACIAXF_02550 [Phycisphaerales bacterium JB063]
MPNNLAENTDGFTTQICLWLEDGLGRVNLAQVGADFVIAAEPCRVPANAVVQVVVSINGNERRLPYLLVDGLAESCLRSKTIACEADGLPF